MTSVYKLQNSNINNLAVLKKS